MHPDDEAYFEWTLKDERARLREARARGDSDEIADAEANLFETKMEYSSARYSSDNE